MNHIEGLQFWSPFFCATGNLGCCWGELKSTAVVFLALFEAESGDPDGFCHRSWLGMGLQRATRIGAASSGGSQSCGARCDEAQKLGG